MTSWAGGSSRTAQEVTPTVTKIVAPPRISVGPAPEVAPVVTKSAVQPTEGGVMSRLFADGDSVGGRAGPVGYTSAMATTAEAGPTDVSTEQAGALYLHIDGCPTEDQQSV
jgi:hypothetical protein